MESTQVDNKRITKNATVLYLRMAVTMFVSFYTSRVILQVLGVVDFGIYNVVYGVTMIVTFFSGSLMNVAQRYLNLGIGENDLEKTNNFFNQFVLIFCTISIVVLIIGEFLSECVIESLLNIPEERIYASHWVYQLSLFALVLTLIQIPFQAAVIANEKMDVFAYITLFESFGKLGILYLVQAMCGDNLILYVISLFGVSFIVFCSYFFYCINKFAECRLKYYFNKRLAREMSSFIGYNVYGCFAFSLSQQGVNVLLNIFFGPAVNAARAIAMQVNQGVYKFSDNILIAVRPPIIKLYAQKDNIKMINLSVNTTRYCLYINTLFVLPIIFNSEYILKLWLGTVPEYTGAFVGIILIESFFNIMNQMITILVNATGNLKRNQFYGRTFTLLVLPISYIILLWVKSPTIPIIITLLGTSLYFLNNLYDVHLQLGVNMVSYMKNTILPVIALSLPLSIVCFVIVHLVGQNFTSLLFSTIMVFTMGVIIVYIFLISDNERKKVKVFLNSKSRIKIFKI